MAYIPPALRKKQQNSQNGTPSIVDRHPSLADIQSHYWPTPIERPPTPNKPTITDLDRGEEDAPQEPASQTPAVSVRQHSTLNASEKDPNSLAYVLLFHDANPRWKDDKIIYAKSELHILPSQTQRQSREQRQPVGRDQSPQSQGTGGQVPEIPTQHTTDESVVSDSPSKPLASNIAIFEQRGTVKGDRGRFEFIGYHRLAKMEILVPESQELVRMLEQKWTRTSKSGKTRQVGRDAASWKKSLSLTWAVLQFEKEDGEMEAPDIELEQESKESRKGVSEMLTEMRLNGADG